MMEITFHNGEVIVRLPKAAMLVVTREPFIEAVRRGTAYRRRQARVMADGGPRPMGLNRVIVLVKASVETAATSGGA